MSHEDGATTPPERIEHVAFASSVVLEPSASLDGNADDLDALGPTFRARAE